ncbi:MAG: hypothetical protein M1828_001743 [Chrysothrix sp. TS-e1954]|nr:MAG: hypothetical protein M1828_001743 [Chrysothrix sp. TS-e1954]
MASARSSVPIILCGAKVALGQESANFMKPEYEVIHFCASVEAACAEIPRLLSSEDPLPEEANEVGTHNYKEVPKAILFGRTYTDDKLQAVRDACKGKGVISWVVPGEPAASNETIVTGHATKVATNMKNVLDGLCSSGTIGKEGLYKYAF